MSWFVYDVCVCFCGATARLRHSYAFVIHQSWSVLYTYACVYVCGGAVFLCYCLSWCSAFVWMFIHVAGTHDEVMYMYMYVYMSVYIYL